MVNPILKKWFIPLCFILGLTIEEFTLLGLVNSGTKIMIIDGLNERTPFPVPKTLLKAKVRSYLKYFRLFIYVVSY